MGVPSLRVYFFSLLARCPNHLTWKISSSTSITEFVECKKKTPGCLKRANGTLFPPTVRTSFVKGRLPEKCYTVYIALFNQVSSPRLWLGRLWFPRCRLLVMFCVALFFKKKYVLREVNVEYEWDQWVLTPVQTNKKKLNAKHPNKCVRGLVAFLVTHRVQ